MSDNQAWVYLKSVCIYMLCDGGLTPEDFYEEFLMTREQLNEILDGELYLFEEDE